MDKTLLEVPSILETGCLLIRKYQKGDGNVFFHLLEKNNNREYLKSHVDEATMITTQEEAEVRVRQFDAFWVARDRFVMGIWLKTSNEYIGQLWIEPKKWEVPSFELGWFLERTYQGHGFATEAVNKAIEFLFNNLKAHKIIVLTRDDNRRSSKLAERCGLIKEGHLKDHAIDDRGFFGLFCYRLLQDEYPIK